MTKRKSKDQQIAEALELFESMKERVPADNQVALGILGEVEEKLHKELKEAVLQKAKGRKKD